MKTDFDVTLKINGQELVIDLRKVDDTWLAHCLTYGVRRFINDSHSAAKGQEKYEACLLMAKDMANGKPMPEKVRKTSSGTSGDPVLSLALRNAKASLTALFKKVTGQAKAVDFAKHEKVAPFFTVADDKATWIDAVVIAWMAKQKEAGKVDYMADAKATLAMADDGLGDDLDF